MSPPSDQLVTSSDLVRHFGLWQERAVRAPLYILHRGRPRFVMTSIETMEALCAPHAEGDPREVVPSDQIDATALLDGVTDLVLVADAGGTITASSRAARAHFGPLAAPGAQVEAITSPAMRGFLADAIRRVVRSGVGDRLELASAAREGRMLTLAIAAAGSGVALFGQDGTTEREHNRALAAERALGQAMVALGGVASVTINPRGYITEPTASLAALTGLTRETLATIRFAALIDLGGRVAVSEAIEAVMTGRVARSVDAAMLVKRADPVRVRIGMAPLHAGGAIDGVAAVVARIAAPPRSAASG